MRVIVNEDEALVTTKEQEMKWDEYLQWCRANDVRPDLSQFFVWLEDMDYA